MVLLIVLGQNEASTKAPCNFKYVEWIWINQNQTLRTCRPSITKIDDEDFIISSPKDITTLGIVIESKKDVKFLPRNLSKVMPNLGAMRVFDCSVKSISRKHFEGLSKMLFLNLARNKIENVSNDAFVDLVGLEVLNLSFNHIRCLNGKTFAGLRALKQLQLHSNKINIIDEIIFQNLENLNLINFNDNELTKISRNLFKNDTKLEKILLGSNFIEVIDENSFDYLPQLKIVDLSENFCVNRKYTKGFDLVDLKEKCSRNSSLEIMEARMEDFRKEMDEKHKIFTNEMNKNFEKETQGKARLQNKFMVLDKNVSQTNENYKSLSDHITAVDERINNTIQNTTSTQNKSEARLADHDRKHKEESEMIAILREKVNTLEQDSLQTYKNLNKSLEDHLRDVNATLQASTEFLTTVIVLSSIFMFCVADFLIALIMYVVYKYSLPRISCQSLEKKTCAFHRIENCV